MAIGYAAPIISMVQLCIFPAQAIGQNLGRFPYAFLNENHRHSLDCGVVGAPKQALLTRGSSRTRIGAITWSLFW